MTGGPDSASQRGGSLNYGVDSKTIGVQFGLTALQTSWDHFMKASTNRRPAA
jgi:hypothetical protein